MCLLDSILVVIMLLGKPFESLFVPHLNCATLIRNVHESVCVCGGGHSRAEYLNKVKLLLLSLLTLASF